MTTWAMKVELSAKNCRKFCFFVLKFAFSWSNNACSLRISCWSLSFSHFFCWIWFSSSKYLSGRLVLIEHFGNLTSISSLVSRTLRKSSLRANSVKFQKDKRTKRKDISIQTKKLAILKVIIHNREQRRAFSDSTSLQDSKRKEHKHTSEEGQSMYLPMAQLFRKQQKNRTQHMYSIIGILTIALDSEEGVCQSYNSIKNINLKAVSLIQTKVSNLLVWQQTMWCNIKWLL